MAYRPNPSGLPGPAPRRPKNRWLRGIERRPTAVSAAGGFAAYIWGMLLLMSSVFMVIAALTMVVGSAGAGWPDRVVGSALLIAGIAVHLAGRWCVNQYAVQRPH